MLTRPIQNFYYVYFEPFRCGHAVVIQIIVLLHNQIVLELQVMDLPWQRLIWCYYISQNSLNYSTQNPLTLSRLQSPSCTSSSAPVHNLSYSTYNIQGFSVSGLCLVYVVCNCLSNSPLFMILLHKRLHLL